MSSTDLSIIAGGTLKAEMVFVPGGVDSILERIFAEARSTPRDISTPAGRDAIKSLAYKVARSKTALDDMGKKLVADIKAQSAKIDAERKRIRDQLDALKDEVRRPLTDWEDADKARIAAHEEILETIRSYAYFLGPEPPIDVIDMRLDMIKSASDRGWEEFTDLFRTAASDAIKTLNAARVAVIMRERERAELARLIALEAEREAERAEESRQQAARERKEREARIAREAAEAARIDAEARANRLAAEEKAKAARALVAERERAEQAERDKAAAVRKAENDRHLAETRAEKAEQTAAILLQAQANAEAREADKKHRGEIHREAMAALVLHGGLSEPAAKAAVTAIAQGKIAHVKVQY